MKKNLFVLTIVISLMLSSCGQTGGQSKDGEVQQADYVVNIDDSFDSGLELGDSKDLLSPEEADFRALKWGMTKEEVAYAEGSGYREPDENTMYYTRVREEEFPADAEYKFIDGKLVQGIFYITQNKSDNPITVADHDELVESLKSRFGEPNVVDLVYVNEEDSTDDKTKQLELVKQGLLQFRTGWMLEATELRVVMIPMNGEACIGLQYKQTGVEIPVE